MIFTRLFKIKLVSMSNTAEQSLPTCTSCTCLAWGNWNKIMTGASREDTIPEGRIARTRPCLGHLSTFIAFNLRVGQNEITILWKELSYVWSVFITTTGTRKKYRHTRREQERKSSLWCDVVRASPLMSKPGYQLLRGVVRGLVKSFRGVAYCRVTRSLWGAALKTDWCSSPETPVNFCDSEFMWNRITAVHKNSHETKSKLCRKNKNPDTVFELL